MYIHGIYMVQTCMYMFKQVYTHSAIYKHVQTMYRHVHTLFGRFTKREIKVNTTGEIIVDGYAPTSAPHITIALNKEVAIYTGRKRSLEEIKILLASKRAVEEKRIAAYGNLTDQFKAMQTILTWNTIYDAPNNRLITPVSRNWDRIWGGFVMFGWDSYFASFMLVLEKVFINSSQNTLAFHSSAQ